MITKTKRANGSGGIRYKKGRSKPYEARVTIGYQFDAEKQKCKQILKTVGYFLTKKDAEFAISQFLAENDLNQNNNFKTYTFKQLFNYYIKKRENEGLREKTIADYKLYFNHFEKIHDTLWIDLQPDYVKKIMIDTNLAYPSLKKMKNLLCQLSKEALKLRITSYDVAAYISFEKAITQKNPNKITREAFSFDDIWNVLNSGNSLIQDTFNFLIHTGVRISEMLNLKVGDIDLTNNEIIIRQSKTDAGIRIIPLHKNIIDLVKKYVEKSKSGYVFETEKGFKFTDSNFRTRKWQPFMLKMGLQEHRIHDTRITFKTFCTNQRLEYSAVETILGHKQKGLDQTYNRPRIEMLREEINKLDYKLKNQDVVLLNSQKTYENVVGKGL